MRSCRIVVAAAVVVLLLGNPAPAAADITGFLGISPTVGIRPAVGVAVGAGMVIAGFELEYSAISERASRDAPSLQTGMLNGILQTPVPIARMQFYATAGGGLYREELGTASEISVAVNVGGGVKIRLAGPVRVRLDYRVFRLRGSPVKDQYHRVYVGGNLAF